MGLWQRLVTLLRGAPGLHARKNREDVNFPQLESVLQYSIRNKEIFREALSHRSYLQVVENPYAVSNERLEFLGDAVLNLVVAEFLYTRYADAPEGELTKSRARFVNRKALTVYARAIRLSKFLLMSPSTLQVATRGMDTIIADGFEALIGAIYLDGGYYEAKRFVERCLLTALEEGDLTTIDENFKSRLLEFAQAEGLGAPRYVTTNEEGPDHDRTFTVEVFIGGASYGIGHGKNKKDAEQAAAAQAIRHLHPSEEHGGIAER